MKIPKRQKDKSKMEIPKPKLPEAAFPILKNDILVLKFKNLILFAQRLPSLSTFPPLFKFQQRAEAVFWIANCDISAKSILIFLQSASSYYKYARMSPHFQTMAGKSINLEDLVERKSDSWIVLFGFLCQFSKNKINSHRG